MSDGFFINFIWNFKVPKKVKVFLWIFTLVKLNTHSRLKKRTRNCLVNSLEDRRVLNEDLCIQIWDGNTPKRVKFFMWTTTMNNINTMSKVQGKYSNLCISPHVCVMCYKSEETLSRLWLYCEFARESLGPFWKTVWL